MLYDVVSDGQPVTRSEMIPQTNFTKELICFSSSNVTVKENDYVLGLSSFSTRTMQIPCYDSCYI